MKERKLQIIRAADKRFSRHGLGKTTLDEIARDLRIGKATIYHYFISKEELFFQTIGWEISQYLEEVKIIFNNEQVELKERFFNYFLLKESIQLKYKLVYEIILLLLKEDNPEKESEIINQLIKKEEEILHLALSSFYATKIENIKPSLPLYFVMQSWGGLFGNKLTGFTNSDNYLLFKELFYKSFENILT